MDDSTPTANHFTAEGEGTIGSITTYEDAVAAHHLATADPEVDGKMSGAEHETKYGLDRAGSSADPSLDRADVEPENAVDEPEAERAVPEQPERSVDTQGFETTAS